MLCAAAIIVVIIRCFVFRCVSPLPHSHTHTRSHMYVPTVRACISYHFIVYDKLKVDRLHKTHLWIHASHAEMKKQETMINKKNCFCAMCGVRCAYEWAQLITWSVIFFRIDKLTASRLYVADTWGMVCRLSSLELRHTHGRARTQRAIVLIADTHRNVELEYRSLPLN